MGGSDYTQTHSRIGDDQSPIGWEAACQGDVANWVKTDNFVVAFLITSSAHTPDTEAFKVQWSKNEVDWFDVNSADPNDDISHGTSDELNDTDPVGDSCGCTVEDIDSSEEMEGDHTTGNHAATQDDFLEFQIALDASNADDDTEYFFRLYSNSAGAALGTAAATLTTEAVVETYTKEFTFDALLQKEGTKEFTFDALLLKAGTKEFTFDSLLQKSLTKEFTFDALLTMTGTKEFTFDSLLQKTLTKEFTFDSLLQKSLTKEFTFDSMLKIVGTKEFTFDSLLQKEGTKQFTFDSMLKLEQTKPFTFDALLQKSLTKQFTFDAVLLKSLSKEFTFDAILVTGGGTKSFTFDAIVDKVTTPLSPATPRGGLAQKPEFTKPILVVDLDGNMSLGIPISKDKIVVLNLTEKK